MIELSHITRVFTAGARDVRALDDVSLTIPDGEIFGLIGSSGAGKSTLLRCINLLERPDSGEVRVHGVDMLGLGRGALSAERRGIGMIFQQFNLLDSATVFDNIAMPMRLAGVPTDRIRARVDELLGFVELSDKATTYPPRLSGGQKQRVGIARALANNPRILLADEATSALDPETTDSILALLKRVNRELGVTVVIVTHEMQVIAKTCHRVAVMSHGRIVEEGPVLDVFSDPRERITRRFVRTIIDDRVPEALVEKIRATPENYETWRLTYAGEASAGSSLAEVNKTHDVTTSLLYASVHEIDGVVLGVLVVQAKGTPEVLDAAKQYLRDAGVGVRQQDLDEMAHDEGNAA
ncbi:MAG TPA: ATP-binding cassette domain-containing protein [Propionibacterium sp.]|nr:ATP-binding cassette domain-containing protein [Propionibacterium sp.]